MIAETQPLTEITQEALRLLYRELGLVNTIRFLNQFTTGFGNYTEVWLIFVTIKLSAHRGNKIYSAEHHMERRRNDLGFLLCLLA